MIKCLYDKSIFGCWSSYVEHFPRLLAQVQAAPKVKSKREVSEKVEPQTYQERVNAKMAEWLQIAGKARTQSITLQSLEFADELATKLMGHALAMEKIYLRIKEQLKNSMKEADYQIIYEKMEEKLKINEKLQAQLGLGIQVDQLLPHPLLSTGKASMLTVS